MDDSTTRKLTASRDSSTQDPALDEILRAVAHAPARRPPPEPAQPGERWGAGGRYTIERRLGRGGMGTVYSATDTMLHREVALKVLDPGSGDDGAVQRARLLREARIAARIEHERVARIYDVGEHEGALFVAMELVRGVTLRRWMDGRAVAAGEILAVARQIAEGLAALHASGVFHRDLKPENVMLTDQGGVRLLDFGLARQTARVGGDGERSAPVAGEGRAARVSEGESLAFAGTPGYMAPEQCEGKALDARVDVFALGVIVYELVTGVRPFGSGASEEVVEGRVRVAPDFSGAVWKEMPARLQEVCARMLAWEPAERFSGGAGVGDALHGIRGDSVLPAALVPSGRLLPSVAQELANAETEAAPVPRRRGWRVGGLIGVAATLVAAGLMIARSASVGHHATLRPPPVPGMAWVDVGAITVGRSPADLDRECVAIGPGCDRKKMQGEVPSSRVTIAPFQLDVYEVTNEEMATTLTMLGGLLSVVDDEDDHYPRDVRWNKDLGHDGEVIADLNPLVGGIEYGADHSFHARAGREQWPAVQVTWHGARLFCTTRGKSLPTEDEWEAAARGRDDRPWPWGSAPLRCGEVVVPRDGLIVMPSSCPEKVSLGPVGQAAQDVTPDGIHDLGGNVAEWVDAVYVEGNRAARVDAGAADLPKVVRGGSFFQSIEARTSGRSRQLANGVGYNVGFRCAVR